jgi:hypothetical protein
MTPFQGLSAFTITPTDARSRGRVVMVDGALADLGHVPVMGLGDRRCVHRLGDCIQRCAREASCQDCSVRVSTDLSSIKALVTEAGYTPTAA